MEATKETAEERCERTGGHDYSASRPVHIDPWGVKSRRQFFCTFCGKDRPRRYVPAPASPSLTDGERGSGP